MMDKYERKLVYLDGFHDGVESMKPKSGYVDGYNGCREDVIKIIHRFFMDEMHNLETYIDEDDGVSEIYKDTKQANYLLNLNKRLCEKLKGKNDE